MEQQGSGLFTDVLCNLNTGTYEMLWALVVPFHCWENHLSNARQILTSSESPTKGNLLRESDLAGVVYSQKTGGKRGEGLGKDR